MRTYGLIGFPLAHSFSKKYFTEKFQSLHRDDCEYRNYEIKAITLLPEIIQQDPSLLGLNVTRPYKESILALLQGTDAVAAATRAVNTVKITRENKGFRLLGFNTDAYGFETSITPFINSRHRKALLLGTGASSRTTAYVFGKLGIECAFVSRSASAYFSYNQLNAEVLSAYHIVVNTTPVGTWPDHHVCPEIPYHLLTPDHLLFDLVYNPEESLFLQKGKAQGAVTLNGYAMLKLQADKSWEIWNQENE